MVTMSKHEASMKRYIRDGRAPLPKSELTSKVMSANKGVDTRPEKLLRRSLKQIGLSGHRFHWKNVPGRPDIAYPKCKVAVFVHGCFWHRCPRCNFPLPKSHTAFWKQKFRRNVKRDTLKVRALKEKGWGVLVIWEHEIKRDPLKCAEKVKKRLADRKLKRGSS